MISIICIAQINMWIYDQMRFTIKIQNIITIKV